MTISLEASEVCDVALLVSYVVSNASWSSSYEVRVFTKDKTMKVDMCMYMYMYKIYMNMCLQGRCEVDTCGVCGLMCCTYEQSHA